MKKAILILVGAILCLQTSFSQSVIFVKQGADGSGKSWQDALGDLQTALAQAKKGSQIWVAGGTYLPTLCDNCDLAFRQIAFQIPDGVELYGGFQGTETSLNQRRWASNPSTLSGNIGSAEASDNSFTVVYTKNVSPETIVDGFIISGGNASEMSPFGSPERNGGGWFNDGNGAGNRSNPTLWNVVFLNNSAGEGGAFFNHATNGGEANPLFDNCSFVGNRASFAGGAIFNHAENGNGSLALKNCKFVNNEAGLGAAIFHGNAGGTSDPVTKDCQFVNNKASAAGAIFTLGFDKNQLPEFPFCHFFNNRSANQEDISHCGGERIPEKLAAQVAAAKSGTGL